MSLAMLIGVWLLQAAPPAATPPFTSSVKEWSLGGAFQLKQEKFLRWQPVFDPVHPYRGWYTELRPTWLVELAPTHRRWTGLSFTLESAPAPSTGGVGMVRARLQYQLPETQARVGVEVQVTTLVNTASGVGPRVFRPMAFFSHHF